jgi:hypothetical protein
VKRHLVIGGAVTTICCSLWIACFAEANEREREGLRKSSRGILTVAVSLASDTAPDQREERGKVIDGLYDEMVVVETEIQLARTLLDTSPNADFAAIVSAQDASSIGYLRAARQSYARYRGAQNAGDQKWAANHMTAARKYAALAAESLGTLATTNEEHAAKLRAYPFAVRRSPQQARALFEDIKRNGLNAEQRALLQGGGLDTNDIDTFQKAILINSPDRLGVSLVELYTRIAGVRRGWADRLREFATASVRDSGPLSESFLVGNPHDRDALVVLVVRRVAMPPEWTISLSEVESTAAENPAKRLREVEKGKRYEVRLPAKGEIRVFSEVTPVGVVAENTTARWAIEGMIGDELIGGLVQEVNVPGFLPDLQLPGIAPPPKAQPVEETPIAWRRNVILIVAGLLLVIAIAVVVLRLRKRV